MLSLTGQGLTAASQTVGGTTEHSHTQVMAAEAVPGAKNR